MPQGDRLQISDELREDYSEEFYHNCIQQLLDAVALIAKEEKEEAATAVLKKEEEKREEEKREEERKKEEEIVGGLLEIVIDVLKESRIPKRAKKAQQGDRRSFKK